MKKLLYLSLVVVSTLSARAQKFTSQELLRVMALSSGTNNYGVTNSMAVVSNKLGGGVILVLATNTAWTNNAGTLVRNTNYTGIAATNPVAQAALFNDISLFAEKNGRVPVTYIANPASIIATNYLDISPLNFYVTLTAVSNVTATVGFQFAPVWDGQNIAVSTADDWSIVIPAAAQQITTFATNVPMWKWPGARSIRLRYVTNDIASNGTNTLLGTWIQSATFNGFIP